MSPRSARLSPLHATCGAPSPRLHATCAAPSLRLHATCAAPSPRLHATCGAPSPRLHATCAAPLSPQSCLLTCPTFPTRHAVSLGTMWRAAKACRCCCCSNAHISPAFSLLMRPPTPPSPPLSGLYRVLRRHAGAAAAAMRTSPLPSLC
eukprot:86620-Chlamydomonas_euryale.AAC.1